MKFKVGQLVKSRYEDPAWKNVILSILSIEGPFMTCYNPTLKHNYRYLITTWEKVFELIPYIEVKKKNHLPKWW